MRIFISLFLILLILSSCDVTVNNKQSNPLFLSIEEGISSKEYDEVCERLVNEGKLFEEYNQFHYIFYFNTENNDFQTIVGRIEPEMIDNKLSRIKIIFEGDGSCQEYKMVKNIKKPNHLDSPWVNCISEEKINQIMELYNSKYGIPRIEDELLSTNTKLYNLKKYTYFPENDFNIVQINHREFPQILIKKEKFEIGDLLSDNYSETIGTIIDWMSITYLSRKQLDKDIQNKKREEQEWNQSIQNEIGDTKNDI